MPFLVMLDAAGNVATRPGAYTAKRHYGEKACVSATRQGNDIVVNVPLLIFQGLHVEGFPYRINVFGEGFAWQEQHPLPSRLTHADFNPDDLGWLV